MENTWITVQQASELSGYSKDAVRNWIKLGLLPSVPARGRGNHETVDKEILKQILKVKRKKSDLAD